MNRKQRAEFLERARMNEKVRHVVRLLDFLKTDHFEAPPEMPGPVVRHIGAQLKYPDRLTKDVVNIAYVPAAREVTVFSADESHHSGSLYDKLTETFVVTDEFLDFAIECLRKDAERRVERELREAKERKFRAEVRARMNVLGL